MSARSRIRVMQVTHDLGIGGLPRVVVTLATTLDRERFDVSVLCMRDTGALAGELEEAGIRVHRVPSPGQPDRLAALRVARILRRQHVEVLHTHNTQPFLEAGLAGVLTGVKTLVHTDHGREFPDLRRYMWAERVMSRFTYRVVGVSEQTTRALVQWEKLDPRRVVTIENGIDERPFREAADPALTRSKLHLDPDAVVIGTVARFQPEKGVDVLIDAMPAVIARVPECVCLIVGYGEQEAALQGRAEARGLGDHVRFLGARRDVPDLLCALDCYVLPSRREGLPMAILEAMAAARPIVAT
ncbi:MAG: glycosyltransferase, partial [Gemmatimonadota bacterium]